MGKGFHLDILFIISGCFFAQLELKTEAKWQANVQQGRGRTKSLVVHVVWKVDLVVLFSLRSKFFMLCCF